MLACDFFTVETLWLGRLYVLCFIEPGTRRTHVAGCTANPGVSPSDGVRFPCCPSLRRGRDDDELDRGDGGVTYVVAARAGAARIGPESGPVTTMNP
jgi:hypothetical protein